MQMTIEPQLTSILTSPYLSVVNSSLGKILLLSRKNSSTHLKVLAMNETGLLFYSKILYF